jgi:hypothetical protein
MTLVALSWFIDWRRVLTVVKPDTLIRWHRNGDSADSGQFDGTEGESPKRRS